MRRGFFWEKGRLLPLLFHPPSTHPTTQRQTAQSGPSTCGERENPLIPPPQNLHCRKPLPPHDRKAPLIPQAVAPPSPNPSPPSQLSPLPQASSHIRKGSSLSPPPAAKASLLHQPSSPHSCSTCSHPQRGSNQHEQGLGLHTHRPQPQPPHPLPLCCEICRENNGLACRGDGYTIG